MIIGSTALKYHFPDFPRNPKDLDIAVREQKPREGNTEYLVNTVLLDLEDGEYISPNMLLNLKISHMFWDNGFDKHMFDIQFLLKKGCTYDLNTIPLFRKYFEIILPKIRRSVLAQSKEDFFDNAVNEDIDEHDYLHTLINPVPMYTLLLKEGSEVELDENKWNSMSYEEKCDVVREETYVMSFERYKDIDYRAAYKRQLKDNIIKHFPFYIALFAIENYIKLERPTIDYRNLINSKLEYDKV